MRLRCFFRAFPIFFLIAVPWVFAEKVRHVVDGDTLVLEDNQRVRLIGIDTPEVDHPRYNKVGEPFGSEARAFLASRVENKEVRLVAGKEAFDKYGRRLAYVYAGDECLNETLLREGLAEAIRYLPYEQKEAYIALEKSARDSGRGMWGSEKSRPEARAQVPAGRWGENVVLLISGAGIAFVFMVLQRRR